MMMSRNVHLYHVVQATRELAQGANESKTGVDPLIVVLGPAQGRRTRGLECDIGQEGNHSFVQMRSNVSSTKSIRRKEHQGKQNESISTNKVDVPSSVQRKSNLSSTTRIIKDKHQGEKVACATATVYSIRDDTVHFKKLLKGHMKVSVIKVVKIHKSMELLVPDDEILNLEFAVKGFIQWPIAAITRFPGMSKTPVSEVQTKRVIPRHKNAPSTKKGTEKETLKEPSKQDKALEETTKHQKTMQKIDEVKQPVEKEKASNRKSLQALEDEVPWCNERPLENKELNAIIGAWFTLWRD
uniref:Ulp1 protease family, C-terminal catalytic domain-containing protein n=1 Tax=Tanacetum cinerariifolium TaxID=118510 RepID=A0A6L2NKC2_TANCI|nr:ulp1 protease family, C-terminal catalytic domain-containing protein [Tanacetum cinerariifolium]